MKRNDKRTTVSLAQVVWVMAEEMMAVKGFNENFSSYVADLIRRDKERAVNCRNPIDLGAVAGAVAADVVRLESAETPPTTPTPVPVAGGRSRRGAKTPA